MLAFCLGSLPCKKNSIHVFDVVGSIALKFKKNTFFSFLSFPRACMCVTSEMFLVVFSSFKSVIFKDLIDKLHGKER